MQKRKKRRVKGDPRLSFCDDIENGSDEDDFENRTLLLTHPWSYYSIVSLPHLWTFVYHTFSLFFGTICGLLHWTRFFLCFTISLLVCGDYCLSFHISFASIVRIIWWLILNVHMFIIWSCTCFCPPIIAYCDVAFKFYKLFGEVLSWWFRPMRTLVLHFFLSQYWVWKLTSVGVVFF